MIPAIRASIEPSKDFDNGKATKELKKDYTPF